MSEENPKTESQTQEAMQKSQFEQSNTSQVSQTQKSKMRSSQNRKLINANPYNKNGSTMSTSKSQNSHSQSMGSLYQVKQNHKVAQIKLNVITNRINKLSVEDNMLQKKADDIKERANQIYEIKRREQMKKQEAKRKKIEVDEIPFTHPVGQLEMIKCQISKKFVQDKHKDDAQYFKSLLAKDFAQKAKEDQVQMENLRWKVQQVRQQEKQAKRKQQEFLIKKLESVQSDQMNVFEVEKKQIEQKESLLKKLEQVEMEQIKKLKTTKQRNQEALEQLDFCKNHQPKDYEDKFGKSPSNKQPPKKINGLPASKFQNQATHIYLEQDKNGNTIIKSAQV
ncbi:hypothetical protein ABPG72_006123 [Tetrahymena utriculariae]